MSKPQLIISGPLPAAGPLPLGHLLEVLAADTFARALRLAGDDAALAIRPAPSPEHQAILALYEISSSAPGADGAAELTPTAALRDALLGAGAALELEPDRLAAQVPPSAVRYYVARQIGAAGLGALSLDALLATTNGELANDVLGVLSRGVPFLADRAGGRYGALGDGAALEALAPRVAEAEAAYRRFDLAAALSIAAAIGAEAAQKLQEGQPWRRVKDAPEEARDLVTLCLALARAAVVLAAPAMPGLAARAYAALGLSADGPQRFSEALAPDLVDRPVGANERLLDKLDKKALDALRPKAAQAPGAAAGHAPAAAPASKKAPERPAEVSIDEFARIDLRVGLVLTAQPVEGSDKLLQLSVDLGEARGPRTVLAGIRTAYTPEQVVGRRVVIVANLAPRKMRFGTSEGMVMAAGPGGQNIWLLEVSADAPIGSEVK